MIRVWSAWGAASLVVVVVIAVASTWDLGLVAHEYRLLCGLSAGAVVVGWAVVVDTRSRLLYPGIATSRD